LNIVVALEIVFRVENFKHLFIFYALQGIDGDRVFHYFVSIQFDVLDFLKTMLFSSRWG